MIDSAIGHRPRMLGTLPSRRMNRGGRVTSRTQEEQEWLSLARTYTRLRRGVGLMGTLLPFALVAGDLLLTEDRALQGTMSAYYYTDMRNLFVGVIFAIGVTLICYRHAVRQYWVTTIAGVMALLVALFPTPPPGEPADWINIVHAVSASVFALSLAWVALVLFPRPYAGQPDSSRSRSTIVLYRFCGTVIVASVALGAIVVLLLPKGFAPATTILWLESAATVAFGVSWLVKGEHVLPSGGH